MIYPHISNLIKKRNCRNILEIGSGSGLCSEKLNLKEEDLHCELELINDVSDCCSDINIQFSEFIFDFLERNKEIPGLDEFVMNITWNLDTYIEKYFGKEIDEDSFVQRIEVLKNRLLHWEKVNSK